MQRSAGAPLAIASLRRQRACVKNARTTCVASILTRNSIIEALRGIDLTQTNPTRGGYSVFTGWGGKHDLAGSILVAHGYTLPPYDRALNFCSVVTLLQSATFSYLIEVEALALLADLQILSDDGNKWADVVALVVGDLRSAA